MSDLAINIRLQRGDFELALETELPGQMVTGIYGPSGSGKTSLLACIAGLTKGNRRIALNGDKLEDSGHWVAPHQRDIAFVFQDARLFPHLDTAANLEYAYRRRRRDGPAIDDVVARFELTPLLRQRPAELSAGQQQRVAIARAVLSAPRLLLLDEPLANIDPAGRRKILTSLSVLRSELGMSIVYVSHDMAELAEMADYLLVLSEGQLVAEGPMLDLSSRLELALAHEEQAAAIASATVTKQDPEYGLTGLDFEGQPLWVNHLDAEPGTALRVRLPARDISLCRERPERTSILNILKARITEIEPGTGSRVLIRLAVGGQFLLARVTRKSVDSLSLQPGDELYAQVKSVALLNDSRND